MARRVREGRHSCREGVEVQSARQGPHVGDPFWSVRVPIDYLVAGKTNNRNMAVGGLYPGPRQRVPWSNGGQDADADAVPAGGIYPADPELELLTPLDVQARQYR